LFVYGGVKTDVFDSSTLLERFTGLLGTNWASGLELSAIPKIEETRFGGALAFACYETFSDSFAGMTDLWLDKSGGVSSPPIIERKRLLSRELS
jgi:hypothetical protein